jgi:hypothetical protein
VFRVLEGKNVNLRIMEREDLPLVSEWFNNPEYGGEYEPLEQITMKELEKWYDNPRPNEEWFIVEKKNKSKIGHIFHIASGRCFEIARFSAGSGKSRVQERRAHPKRRFHPRPMARWRALQHSSRRMERTKNIDKGNLGNWDKTLPHTHSTRARDKSS